ncbi:MAG TPA: polysaccharide deacetylase family protein [Candidatus Binatia bacterium]|nr:polysaccharide deacetylase family protein [Candidatus Binatia bacterium]
MSLAWPNGKRIAIAVAVMYESWSDGKAPQYSVQTTSLKPEMVNFSGITWAQYGGRAGVWRIINTLDRHGIKGTFAVSARSAELYPDSIKQIVRSGHDVAGHAYTQDGLQRYMTPDEERAMIRRSLSILETAAGRRPTGWFSPVLAWTEHTSAILVDEGILYQADSNDVDLPYCATIDGKKLVKIPASDFTDNRVLRASPRDFYDVYKGTFDYLYKNEPGSYLAFTLHCHFGGRPIMQAVFDQILSYYSTFPDVWFVRHDELAKYVRDKDILPVRELIP